jgi:hypothetical protein
MPRRPSCPLRSAPAAPKATSRAQDAPEMPHHVRSRTRLAADTYGRERQGERLALHSARCVPMGGPRQSTNPSCCRRLPATPSSRRANVAGMWHACGVGAAAEFANASGATSQPHQERLSMRLCRSSVITESANSIATRQPAISVRWGAWNAALQARQLHVRQHSKHMAN